MWRTSTGYLTKPINGHVTRGDNNKGQIFALPRWKVPLLLWSSIIVGWSTPIFWFHCMFVH